MIDELESKIKYLESENSLLKSLIRKKNAIIYSLTRKIKILECGIDPKNFDGVQLTIYDFIK